MFIDNLTRCCQIVPYVAQYCHLIWYVNFSYISGKKNSIESVLNYMKKIILLALAIIIVLAYIVFKQVQKPESTSLSTPTINPTSSTNASPNAATGNRLKDGEFTGVVADAFYGPIQASVVIKNGLISDVKFLQFPDKKGHTTEVSSMSLPILKEEAIKTQSSKVDNVTGATQTTDAFRITLQSALDKALAS